MTLDLSSSSSSKKKSTPVNEPAATRKDLLSRIDALVDQESTKQREASETKPREDESTQKDRVDSEHNDDDEVDEEDEQLRPLTIERSLLDRYPFFPLLHVSLSLSLSRHSFVY